MSGGEGGQGWDEHPHHPHHPHCGGACGVGGRRRRCCRRVAAAASYRLERLSVALHARRLDLELALAGAILGCPRVGILRADETGVTAALFAEREDARAMYLAARYCADRDLADDKGLVLRLVRHALVLAGLWDDGARREERRTAWSARNLAALACERRDPPRDVIRLAPQLIDLDRRLRVARRCVRRAIGVMDEWGEKGGESEVVTIND